MAKATIASDIITDLQSEAKVIKIVKVAKKDSVDDKGVKNGEYYIITAVNLDTNLTLTLTLSDTMRESFGFADLIEEANYTGRDIQPIYTNCEVVYVPNDGKKYGYIVKEKDGTESTREYRKVGTHILKQFTGTLSATSIEKYESITVDFQAIKSKADNVFKLMKGRSYIAGRSEQDDEFYMNLLYK